MARPNTLTALGAKGPSALSLGLILCLGLPTQATETQAALNQGDAAPATSWGTQELRIGVLAQRGQLDSDAEVEGATLPANDAPVQSPQEELGAPPVQRLTPTALDALRRYWALVALTLGALLVVGGASLRMAWLNRHLAQARDDLRRSLTQQGRVEQDLRNGLDALHSSQETFQRLTTAARDAIVMTDGAGRVTYWNAAAERLFGYSAQEAIGTPVHQWLAPPDVRPQASAAYAHFAATGEGPIVGGTREIDALHRDGHLVPVEISVAALQRDDHWEAIGILRDISERRQLEHMQTSFTNVVMKNRSGILVVDRKGAIRFSNPAAEKSLGHPAADLEGLPFGYPSTGTHTELDILRPDGGFGVAEVTATQTVWNDEPAHLVMLHDITDRKRAEEQVRHQALHDALTGLPNRVHFLDRLHQALEHARREARPLAVLFLDLDRFKAVNDTLGHRVGDDLLKAVAQRLGECLRSYDLVARLGGDEFTVLADQISSPKDAEEVAQRIATAFRTPLAAAGHLLHSKPSIGIALYPEHGEDAETLMQNADTAMYEAKKGGVETGFAFYQMERPLLARLRLNTETRLRTIIEAGGLRLRFQPQADMRSECLCGAEALLRCVDEHGRLLLPERFIPAMEQTGLIRQAGDWVLTAVCAQIRAWIDAGLDPPPVALNLSAFQLDDGDLPGRIAALLDLHGLGPDRLICDVTETAVMRRPEQTRGVLEGLVGMGLGLHLDDFGTGQSSLALLGDIAFSMIKVDRSLVRELPHSKKHAALIAAMLAMAHHLGLKVVAEGVETRAQWELLYALGCDVAQGFLTGHPMTPGHFARLCLTRARGPLTGNPGRGSMPTTPTATEGEPQSWL
jgi:diguanylate cyclase (GGDEF)-like protein/PAS domain S-box-containing protein